jgi:hypothetical protein
MTTITSSTYTVRGVVRQTRKRWLGGVGPEAKFEDEPTGWLIQLDGTNTAILTAEDPGLVAGERVTLTLGRATAELTQPAVPGDTGGTW